HRPPSLPLFPYTTLFRSSVQPRARDLPLSFDGGDRKAQGMAGFLEREPAEEFQFGDLALACVEGRQVRQGRIEIQHVDVTRLVLDRKSTRLNSSHQIISY